MSKILKKNYVSSTSIDRGIDFLRTELKTMTHKPGVYRMQNSAGEVLYVGKARNLSRRLTDYTQPKQLSNRILRMISETHSLEIIVTKSEIEALLLESNLIKKMKPRYNILLRDDKSLPQILLTDDHDFSQLTKHRGRKTRKGKYYGPFASAGSVNRTVTDLARAFMLRTCSDGVFATRTRPCIQYQIKRCTAPCVGFVTKEDYSRQVSQAKRFLDGDSAEIHREYASKMHAASDELDFESAAIWRNRIRALSGTQANQVINLPRVRDADIIAAAQSGNKSCIQIFFIRGGSNYGNRSYFLTHLPNTPVNEIVGAFIGQFYENKTPPSEIIVNSLPDDYRLRAEALTRTARYTVRVLSPARGERKKVTDMALKNAKEALSRYLANTASQRKLLEELKLLLNLPSKIQRIEVFDNSHIQGKHAVGAMVVAGPEGFNKGAYRKFNIRDDGKYGTSVGDDFNMMRQVIHRRFSRALQKNQNRDNDNWPDLLLIDGGVGQLRAVCKVLAELDITQLNVLAISKGTNRRDDNECLHMLGRESFTLPRNCSTLHFLQRLRDEAHRYAIGSHRLKKTKSEFLNPLDAIPGIGPKRKKALMDHFGSARAVSAAGLSDLETVSGISKKFAQQIYDWFYSGN